MKTYTITRKEDWDKLSFVTVPYSKTVDLNKEAIDFICWMSNGIAGGTLGNIWEMMKDEMEKVGISNFSFSEFVCKIREQHEKD